MTEHFSNNNDEAGSLESIGLFIWDLVKVFIIAFVVVWLFLRPFVAEPFIVSGSSMVPNFHDKQYLIIEKWSYRFGEPARGDIIVFKYPKDPSQYFIKRIIGMPGDTVTLREGHVYISNSQHPDGYKLEEPFIQNKAISFGRTDSVTVGPGEYYVLGDNRLQSSDSRVWGVLPEKDIVGKVWLRVLPISKFGITEHAKLGN